MASVLARGLRLALSAASLVSVLCTAVQPAVAGARPPAMVLYRYTDSRGVKVLDSQGVPAQYAGKGYEVLNQQGRVIQVVAPAPTADELRIQQAEQAKATADAQLLKKYPSLAELERAQARKQLEIEGAITVARGNQQALQVQQQALQGQAAEQERAGRPVPQATLDDLQNIRSQRAALETKVQTYEQAKVQADKDFADLKARLAPLLAP